jgi:hypothetical protein
MSSSDKKKSSDDCLRLLNRLRLPTQCQNHEPNDSSNGFWQCAQTGVPWSFNPYTLHMNQTYAVRVNSKAIFENNEIANTSFQAVQTKGQISLVLDSNPPDRDVCLVLFHPLQEDLIRSPDEGPVAVYQHVGAPIDLTAYLKLPLSRRGFHKLGG